MTNIRYGWHLVSISWYCLVLDGTGSAKGLYACIYWKKWRFGRVTPMPDTLTHSQTTEYRATQLLSSIQFKLSHATSLHSLFLPRWTTNDISTSMRSGIWPINDIDRASPLSNFYSSRKTHTWLKLGKSSLASKHGIFLHQSMRQSKSRIGWDGWDGS